MLVELSLVRETDWKGDFNIIPTSKEERRSTLVWLFLCLVVEYDLVSAPDE